MKKIVINRKDLKKNLQIIQAMADEIGRDDNGNPLKIIGVVKGNGMGLGLESYAKFLVKNGITMLAVANFEEAIQLRDCDVQEEILMMTPVYEKKELQKLIDERIILTIGCLEDVQKIEACVKENKDIKEVPVHLKIDTGFGRYGIVYTNIQEILDVFNECQKVKIVGTYTHFSKPMDKKWTNLQFHRFIDVIEQIKKAGLDPGLLHCSASTAFLLYPHMCLNAVRIGSAIQGRTLVKQKMFRKVGNFQTNIVAIKQLPKGYPISYHRTYKTKKETKIAIIPVGYMDGFHKDKLRDDFSFKNNLIAVGMEIKKIFKDNRLKVSIQGKAYPVLGKIGMYHAIIDITGNNELQVGEIVTLTVTPLQANEKIRREYI